MRDAAINLPLVQHSLRRQLRGPRHRVNEMGASRLLMAFQKENKASTMKFYFSILVRRIML